MLNEDQQAGIKAIRRWLINPNDPFFILKGEAGTGKTFLLEELLTQIPDKVLLTAPTNEAVFQMVEATKNKYEYATIYKALGYSFDTSKEVKELKKTEGLDLSKYRFIVVDEASMVTDFLIQALYPLDIKVLFMGHALQLPPPEKDISITSKCHSTIFTMGLPEHELKIQQRNNGAEYEYCRKIAAILESGDQQNISIPSEFFLSTLRFKNLKKSGLSDKFYEDKAKLICWQNSEVDRQNLAIRHFIYSDKELKSFMIGDKMLFIEPCLKTQQVKTAITDRNFSKVIEKESYYVNDKFEVCHISCLEVFGVLCHKLLISGRLDGFIYVPVKQTQYEAWKQTEIANIYKHRPYEQVKLWQKFHQKDSLFAKVKHSYAITAYRAQGMTKDTVIVNWQEMRNDPVYFRRLKQFYVGISRVKEKLWIL